MTFQLSVCLHLLFVQHITFSVFIIYIFIMHFYHLNLQPHMVGGDIKVYIVVKPNLVHTLVFNKHTRAYYLNTKTWN